MHLLTQLSILSSSTFASHHYCNNIFLSFCLFICLSICLFVCLLACLLVCLPVCLFFSLFLFVCLFASLLVCLSVCPYLCVCLSVYLLVCQTVCLLSTCLFVLRAINLFAVPTNSYFESNPHNASPLCILPRFIFSFYAQTK